MNANDITEDYFEQWANLIKMLYGVRPNYYQRDWFRAQTHEWQAKKIQSLKDYLGIVSPQDYEDCGIF